MAMTSQGMKGWVLLADNSGKTTRVSYALTATTFADALTDMGAIVAALGPITNSVIVGYSVGEAYEESAVVLPDDGVQNEVKAVISAKINVAGEKWATLRVPAPNIGIFSAATGELADVIDGADAALGTYLALFGVGGVATVSDGEVLKAPGTDTVKGRRS